MKIFVVLCCLFALCFSKQIYENYKVVTVEITSEIQKQLVEKLFKDSVDIWSNEGVLIVGKNDIFVSPKEMKMIDKVFPKKTIKIENVQELINQEEETLKSMKTFTLETPTEEFFKKYHRYEQILTFLKKIQSEHPSLVEMFSIGKSTEGREIMGVKISDKSITTPKKTIWVSSHQHAREWISSMVPLYILSTLLSEYKKNVQRIVNIFKKTNFIFVTNQNPDGYEFSHTNSRMWRKNRKVNHDRTIGVDLNRNWPYKWGGPGASRSPGSDTYMGTGPASEIEVQNVIKVFNTTKIHGALDFHSYSQLLLRPWQWSSASCPDESALQALGQKYVDAVRSNGAQSYRNIRGSQLYVHSGAMVDFFYGEKKIFGYTVELRDTGRYGFLLPPSLILPTCVENYFGTLEFIEHFNKN